VWGLFLTFFSFFSFPSCPVHVALCSKGGGGGGGGRGDLDSPSPSSSSSPSSSFYIRLFGDIELHPGARSSLFYLFLSSVNHPFPTRTHSRSPRLNHNENTPQKSWRTTHLNKNNSKKTLTKTPTDNLVSLTRTKMISEIGRMLFF
jgi:hypothetical protein